MTSTGAEATRPPYRMAAAAGAVVFALYALTLARTTQFWDTSEYIATGHILGIPHPPGNPLFVVLARTWDVLLAPTGLAVAVRINLFSAFISAAAHGLWFLVIERVLSHFSDDRLFRRAGALAAVIVSATAFTVWNQSNVNEKVYTVSLLTIALLTWLAFRWRDELGRGRDDNRLVLIVFLLALSVGNHLMAFLAAPALALFVVMVHPRTLTNYRLYLASAVAVLLGLSVHLFLPIRAALDPVINEADPTCGSIASALWSIVTWGQAGCEELSHALSRTQYEKPPLVPRLAPLHAQLGNYLQYFDWQWSRALDGANALFGAARVPFTLLFAGLGMHGAFEHFRRDRTSAFYVLVLFATLSVGLIFYLNFRYGFTFPGAPEGREFREVRERDYFFIVGFSVWGLWAGVGLAAVWKSVAHRVGGLLRAAPVMGVALLPLALNWTWASRAHDYSARDWAYNLLMSAEPYAVLFTNGDNDTFPLWYLQEVEGIRRDVAVIVTSYLQTEWYAFQLRDITTPCPDGVDPLADPTRAVCQRPYDGAATGQPELYAGSPTPTRSILALDDATIMQIARNLPYLSQAQPYQVGNVRATLPANQYLEPWMQFGLAILDASLGDRPIYFASSGDAPSRLGLREHLIRQGLAYRLYDGDLSVEAPPGVVRTAGTPLEVVIGPWVDVPRTRTLAEDVFMHRTGIPDEWDHWPDHSTIGIPNYYAWVYYALAQAAAIQGDAQAVERFTERAEAWSLLGS